ncbi:MAG: four helix bundle protein [Candidatus Sifarchaeia archaeon]
MFCFYGHQVFPVNSLSLPKLPLNPFPFSPETSLKSHINPGTIARLRSQIEDAARSMVSTFEESWGRPSTKEYLDFIGYSQGSLTEIRGDIERCLTDKLIASNKYKKATIPTPSRTHPYPPVKSRRNPGKYGDLRVKLREYSGRDISKQDLTYELYIELINKSDYLLKKTVEGLQKKIISDEKRKLKDEINSHFRKHW